MYTTRMSDCIFCKIVSGEIPSHKVYEDEHVFACLDHTPVSRGHTLVMPKKHVKNIFDAGVDTWGATMEAVRALAPKVRNAVDADGINIHINNESAAGQVVMHSHIHIIPRFENDGLELWHGKEMSVEELEKIAEKITG